MGIIAFSKHIMYEGLYYCRCCDSLNTRSIRGIVHSCTSHNMFLRLNLLVSVVAFQLEVNTETLYQPGAPWGLSRISHCHYQFNPDGSAFYTDPKNDYAYKAIANNENFDKTIVYVLDSGVDVNHPQFDGRATWGTSFVDSIYADDNGHGTHLAGITVGNTVGVARNASVVAVKVLDHHLEGSVEAFVKAIDWTISHFQGSGARHAVINYSAVGEISGLREKAILKALNAGIPVVGAAGNDNADACQSGPSNLGGGAKEGFFVAAALNYTNTPASFTNYGSCIDVYSPGNDIYSSFPNGKYGYLDGTSCAAAFVSGLIAYLWQLDPNMSLGDISLALKQQNPNIVQKNFKDTTGSVIYNMVT